jgi:hypothetical protein
VTLLSRINRLERTRRLGAPPDTLLLATWAALPAPRRAKIEALAEELKSLDYEIFSPRVAEVAAQLLQLLTWPPAAPPV